MKIHLLLFSIPTLLFCTGMTLQAQTNSIRSYRPESPASETSLLQTSPSVPQTIIYLDGLGREVQTVQQDASPGGGDIVLPRRYDAFGRPDREYLPYAATPGGTPGAFRADFEAGHAVHYRSAHSGDPHGYAETVYEASAVSRPLCLSPPGKAWRPGSGRETRYQGRPNLAGEQVRIWTVNAEGLPQTEEIYAAGDLWVSAVTDGEGHSSMTYSDRLGRTVLKKTQTTTAPSKAHAGWHCTYYVFDVLGDLRAVLPPKAVETLDGSWERSRDTELAEGLYFLYRYDGMKRLVEKKSPGKALEETVYDRRDRSVGSRDGKLAAEGEWLYTRYDVHNRPIQTGVVKESRDRKTLQKALDTEAPQHAKTVPETGRVRYGETISAGTHDGRERYTASQAVVLRPGFHFAAKGERVFSANIGPAPVQQGPKGSFPADEGELHTVIYYDGYKNSKKVFRERSVSALPATGLATGKMVSDLTSGRMMESAVHYDDRGREVLALSEDHMGGETERSMRYDFRDRPLEVHTRISGSATLEYADRYAYSPEGRLISAYRRMGKEPETLLASYTYGKTGELWEKNSGGLAPFRYERHIQGWTSAFRPGGQDPTLFSMALSHETGSRPLYDGNISELEWSGRDRQRRHYHFYYDPIGQLTEAAYAVPGKESERNRYNLGNMRYDANGNILSLTRNNRQSGDSYGEVDRLSYRYASHGNQLESIADAVPDAGFVSGSFSPSPSGGNYRYDANGNLVANPNKGISRITYNHLDLPKEMAFRSGEKLQFAYSAEGQLLYRRQVKNGKTLGRTDHLGELVLTDGKPDHLLHLEGRAVHEKGKWVPEYFIRDHLGNVRQVLRKPGTSTVRATMEPGKSKNEEQAFEGLAQSRQAGAEHNSTPGGSHSAWLNAGRGRVLGPARRQKVEAGEKISLSVNGKYRDAGGLSVKPEVFVSSGAKSRLLDGLTEFGSAPAGSGNPVLWLSLADLLIKELQTKPVPEAYMMYVLYDGEGAIYKQGKIELTKKASGKHEYLEANFYIEMAGRMEAFLVNETETDAWFDDFRVETQDALVVQEDHYDPWGLQLGGLEYRAGGTGENRYLYNGKEKIGDSGLDLYDFGARLYDPSIGRWMTVDPMADHPKQIGMSPYNAFWNNPIRYNDPDGRCPECEEKVKDPTDGQSYRSTGGANYTFGNGEWTRQGGTLDEITVTDSRSAGSNFSGNTASLGYIGTGMNLAGEGIWLLGENSSMSLYQQGFRRGLNGNYQLTGRNLFLFGNQPMTSATKPFTGLNTIGNFGKVLSNTGTFLSAASAVFDTYSYSQGNLSGARYSYHMIGIGSSLASMSYLGGPYGAAVGGLFFLGEKTWDMTQPMRNEISSQYWQFKNDFNNALRSGWRPR